MTRKFRNEDRGAGLIEYALLMLLIAMGSMVATSVVGESTSETFGEVAAGFESNEGAAEEEAELTPDEKWAKAKDDYDKAIDQAKSDKAYAQAAAKSEYDSAVASNQSLPKADKKAANKAAKAKYNQAKSDANSSYKNSVNAAKAAKADAKAEWKATK